MSWNLNLRGLNYQKTINFSNVVILIRSFGLQLLDSDPLGWTIREEMNERDPARTLNESRRMICLDESVEDLSVCEGLRCVNVFRRQYLLLFVVVQCAEKPN